MSVKMSNIMYFHGSFNQSFLDKPISCITWRQPLVSNISLQHFCLS